MENRPNLGEGQAAKLAAGIWGCFLRKLVWSFFASVGVGEGTFFQTADLWRWSYWKILQQVLMSIHLSHSLRWCSMLIILEVTCLELEGGTSWTDRFWQWCYPFPNMFKNMNPWPSNTNPTLACFSPPPLFTTRDLCNQSNVSKSPIHPWSVQLWNVRSEKGGRKWRPAAACFRLAIGDVSLPQHETSEQVGPLGSLFSWDEITPTVVGSEIFPVTEKNIHVRPFIRGYVRGL